MPGLNLKTSAIKGAFKAAPEASATVERQPRKTGISAALLGVAVKRADEKAVDVKKFTVFLSQELADARAEISEVHRAVIDIGKRMQESVESSMASVHERLKQASKKVTLVFDVQRDGEGRITSVISRPES